jgi:hypothetical protein
VFTSQLEWKQQFGNEIEASPNISQRDQQQHSSNREEVVKEKVSFFILFSFLNYIWCFLCSVLYVYETRKGKKGKTQLFFLNLGIEDFVPCIQGFGQVGSIEEYGRVSLFFVFLESLDQCWNFKFVSWGNIIMRYD